MRITKIKVKNFKSLVDFQIDLAKFNCIVGLNGSGKSTFLQFIDFLIHLMKGNITEWFPRREWKPADIYNRFDKRKQIEFSIEFLDDENERKSWSATYGPTRGCRSEVFEAGNLKLKTIFKKGNTIRTYVLLNPNGTSDHEGPINFKYDGSILSVMDDVKVSRIFGRVRDCVLSMESSELLAPHFLRQRTRDPEGSIGLEGKGLSSFLFELGPDVWKKIQEQLSEVYPQLSSIAIKKLPYDWKQLVVDERFGNKTARTESRHINDGMLRLIAILAQMQSDRQVLLFDEIENGINPELVGFLLRELVEARQQVVVTTHSALFLNYLDDDLAKECVQYFYKTPEGFTRCRKFFSLPSTARKLGALGPGEAIDDTNLYRLNEEIEQLDRQATKKED